MTTWSTVVAMVLASRCDGLAMRPMVGLRGPATRAAPNVLGRRSVVVRAEEKDLAAELAAQAQALREEAAKIEESLEAERNRETAAELDEWFSEADADGDGSVTLQELRAALKSKLVDENTNRRSAARAESMLASEERVLAILKDLDANSDGVLQREEMVTVANFRDRLERAYRDQKAAEVAESRLSDFRNATDDRLDQWQAVANRTSAAARLVAAAAYLLPALDALPFSLPPPGTGDVAVVDAAVAAIVQTAIAFRTLPFSGLLAFLILSALAGNVTRPRLERFAARHAIILDLAAVFLLPIATAVAPDQAPLAATAFEAVVLVSAVAALAGINAGFVPGTGQLTAKFTDDFEAGVERLLESATAAEFSMLVNATDLVGKRQKPTSDDDQAGGGGTTKDASDDEEAEP